MTSLRFLLIVFITFGALGIALAEDKGGGAPKNPPPPPPPPTKTTIGSQSTGAGTGKAEFGEFATRRKNHPGGAQSPGTGNSR
jgi:hypothetical protein